MPPSLRRISGDEAIKALERLGFARIRQRAATSSCGAALPAASSRFTVSSSSAHCSAYSNRLASQPMISPVRCDGA